MIPPTGFGKYFYCGHWYCCYSNKVAVGVIKQNLHLLYHIYMYHKKTTPAQDGILAVGFWLAFGFLG